MIDSSIAIPDEGIPMYKFAPDLHLPEDNTLMSLLGKLKSYDLSQNWWNWRGFVRRPTGGWVQRVGSQNGAPSYTPLRWTRRWVDPRWRRAHLGRGWLWPQESVVQQGMLIQGQIVSIGKSFWSY